MTHPDQRLRADYGHFAQIDLRLIPQLQPVVPQRLFDIHFEARRLRDRQERRQVLVQIAVAERRAQRRQHGEPDLLAELVEREQRARGTAAEQHDPAHEGRRFQKMQRLGDIALRLQQAEHHQVRIKLRKRRRHVGETLASVRNEAKLLQRVREERADMKLGIDDTDPRHDAPPAEWDGLTVIDFEFNHCGPLR
jgi:hypothetical protein